MTDSKRFQPGGVRGMFKTETDLAHFLMHEYGTHGLALITLDRAGNVRCNFVMGCHVDDDDYAAQTEIAQHMRQGCANLSTMLRKAYVDRTHDDGEMDMTATPDVVDTDAGAADVDKKESVH
jgi:hypothetical protein